MHILIIPSWYPSPHDPCRGQFFRQQAHALKATGIVTGVIAPQPISVRNAKMLLKAGIQIDPYWDDDQLPTFLDRWLSYPKLARVNYKRWIASGMELFTKYVVEFGLPDLIHAHCALYAGILAEHIKGRFGVPYLLTEHSSGFERNIYHPWQLDLAKQALVHADTRIFVSPGLGNLVSAKFGSQIKPWKFIPNMVSAAFTLKNTPTGGSPFRFLSAGSLLMHKGHHNLLFSIARAFGGNHSVRLVIVGKGPRKKALLNLAKRLNISDQVSYLGQLDQVGVEAQMQTCDCFVLPSLIETFGIAIIEALACGKPVIATDCCGPRSIVNDQNGILVPTNDIEKLSEALIHMQQKAHAYSGEAISRDCQKSYGAGQVVGKLLKCYQAAKTNSDKG